MILDVDPEIIRKGVRSLMQQVAQIERERVINKKNYIIIICSLKYLIYKNKIHLLKF